MRMRRSTKPTFDIVRGDSGNRSWSEVVQSHAVISVATKPDPPLSGECDKEKSLQRSANAQQPPEDSADASSIFRRRATSCKIAEFICKARG
jgi:hypothetical protein